MALALVVSLLAAVLSHDSLPVGEKIALLKVEGTIVDSEKLIEYLKSYRKDSSIKAVVLRVNSPGGAVAPSQEIYEEVKKLAATKVVVVSMGAVGASGAYYISAPATKIYANPGTITGSIGVIMELPNLKGLMDKLGIKTEVIKSGKNKDLASIFRGIGKEQRKILQEVIDDVHEQFVQAVAEGRKMPVEKVRKLADGRIFSGRQAKQLGLIDELGNLEDAIKAAAELAGIKGEPRIVKPTEKLGLLDILIGRTEEERLSQVFRLIDLKYIMH
ncbi:MAG: signal peptide peptidase SppA [Nitrospirae bacterium]|nr:MAG: signal peptide peptidase SppA [Nitrospirota bacterium]